MSDGIVARIVSEFQGKSEDNTPEVHHDQSSAIKEPSKITPPFSQYSEINKKPYSADYFKVSYYDKLSPEIDHRDVYKNISEIESYVAGKIKDEKLLDDINTYNLIIEPIKHFLNINDQIKPEKQLSMISQYVKLKIQEKKHNEKLEKVKDAILKVTGEQRG